MNGKAEGGTGGLRRSLSFMTCKAVEIFGSDLFRLIAFKAVCAAVLVLGAALVRFPSSELYQMIAIHFPANMMVRVLVGVAVGLVGLLGLLPLGTLARRGRTITFDDERGAVTFKLAAVEAAMTHAIRALPDVKPASVRVFRAGQGRSVRVRAEVRIGPGSGASACDTVARLKEWVTEAAKRNLGVEDVAAVDITVLNLGEWAPPIIAPAAPCASAELAAAATVASGAAPSLALEPEEKNPAADDLEPLLPGARDLATLSQEEEPEENVPFAAGEEEEDEQAPTPTPIADAPEEEHTPELPASQSVWQDSPSDGAPWMDDETSADTHEQPKASQP